MLSSIFDFLQTEIKPNAEAIDRDVEAMGVAFRAMQSRGLLALKRSAEFGGPEIDEGTFRKFQEEISRASGALAFLQTQHQSSVSLINTHAHPEIQARYLPYMHDEKTVGLGISQLRRSGPQVVSATEVSGGYQVSGHVPWITGLGFFKEYLLGATLPNGNSLFALVPFENIEGQQFSSPMSLTAMEAAQTVTAEISNLFIPRENVAFEKHPGWMKANDAFNITLQGHFAIGCAMAGIDVVRDNAVKRQFDFLFETADCLEAELNSCRQALVDSQQEYGEDTAPERLRKRGWAIDIMTRCAQAAVTSSSGSANYAGHPAGRILRESIVFSVSAQTQPIMAATLKRLTRSI